MKEIMRRRKEQRRPVRKAPLEERRDVASVRSSSTLLGFFCCQATRRMFSYSQNITAAISPYCLLMQQLSNQL